MSCSWRCVSVSDPKPPAKDSTRLAAPRYPLKVRFAALLATRYAVSAVLMLIERFCTAVQNLSISIRTADTAYRVASSAAKRTFNGYLGAANLVLSFAGGFGSDTDTQRHEQLMRALQQIYEELRRFEEQMATYHKEEMERLDAIQMIDAHILQLLADKAEGELRSCHEFGKRYAQEVSVAKQAVTYAQLTAFLQITDVG